MAGPQISRLQNPAVAQSYREPVRAVASADTTVTDADANGTILMTTGAAARTVTLPAASGRSGFRITVKKIDAGAGTVIVDGSGAETVDDAASQTITVQYESLTLVCDGTEWWLV